MDDKNQEEVIEDTLPESDAEEKPEAAEAPEAVRIHPPRRKRTNLRSAGESALTT